MVENQPNWFNRSKLIRMVLNSLIWPFWKIMGQLVPFCINGNSFELFANIVDELWNSGANIVQWLCNYFSNNVQILEQQYLNGAWILFKQCASIVQEL